MLPPAPMILHKNEDSRSGSISSGNLQPSPDSSFLLMGQFFYCYGIEVEILVDTLPTAFFLSNFVFLWWEQKTRPVFSDRMNQFKNRRLHKPCIWAGTSEKPLFWMLGGDRWSAFARTSGSVVTSVRSFEGVGSAWRYSFLFPGAFRLVESLATGKVPVRKIR